MSFLQNFTSKKPRAKNKLFEGIFESAPEPEDLETWNVVIWEHSSGLYRAENLLLAIMCYNCR